MKSIIEFLENNLDIFESALAERYFQIQEKRHDVIYFCVQEKFDSYNNKQKIECYIVMCQTDENHTSLNPSFKMGTFQVFESANSEYEHVLLGRLEKRVEEINKYLKNESVH